MKKIVYVLFFIGSIYACKTHYTLFDNKAQQIFKKNIEIIKKEINMKPFKEYKELEDAVLFLENITGIESIKSDGFIDMSEPSKGNLLDWKEWYKNNKNLLYWDENDKKVKLRE